MPGRITRSGQIDDEDLKVLWRHVRESSRMAGIWAKSQDLKPQRRETANAVAENLRAAAKMLEDLT